MEEQSWKSSGWTENHKAYFQYLNVLSKHETKSLASLASELLKINFEEPRHLEHSLILLERFQEKDLREDQFLISTQDTEKPKGGAKGLLGRPPVLVLDNLRSAFNVGSLFRSAEAFGVREIHLCGYTATPENSKTAKAALGTQEWVTYTHWDNTLKCLDQLKERGYTLYALETAKEAKPLEKTPIDHPAAIILGNERYGLADPVLRRADHLLSIPLRGRKNSLNVAVCGAITLYEVLRAVT